MRHTYLAFSLENSRHRRTFISADGVVVVFITSNILFCCCFCDWYLSHCNAVYLTVKQNNPTNTFTNNLGRGFSVWEVFMSAAVAQSNGVAQTGPPPAPPAPQPWYETPTWSPQPHRPRSTSSTLQQLWLTCPHSFSQLLTPWASSGLRAQSNSSSNPTNQLNQQESVASTKLVSALQQHIQMLACGDSSATVGMLQDLTAFLEVYHMPRSAVHELPGAAASAAAAGAAASQRTLSQGLSHPAGSADSMQPQAAAEAASEVAVSAALQVVSVLVAHDKACQQAVVQPLGPHPDPTKTHTQVPVQC